MAFVRTEGFAELDQALGELKESTAKGVLRRVAAKALQPFDQAWRANAPVLTGQLERSGGVGTKLTRRQKTLQAEARDSLVEVYAGPGANPQAIQEEFGNDHQPPHPFVRPAWDQTQGQVIPILAQELGPEIEKTAKRAEARAAARAAKIAAGG